MSHLDGAELALQHAQVVVRLGIPRRSRDRCLQHLSGLRRAALGGQDDGQVVEALREVGAQLQRRLVAAQRACSQSWQPA